MRWAWLVIRRFLAARTAARIDIWHLMHDLLKGGEGMEAALEIVMKAKRRETFRVGMLAEWQAALASGTDDFAVEVSRWVPPSEAMVFYGLGRARAEELFLAAAKVAEMRARQVRAILNALAMPMLIFAGCIGMSWYTGYELLPEMRKVSDPDRWDVFSRFMDWMSTGIYEHDALLAALLALAVAGIWLAIVRWTGRGRAVADRVPPFSLYRVLSGTGFLFCCIEFLRLGVDLNENTFSQFERGASPYVRSRIRAVRGLMLNEGMGFGAALAASGHEFPDDTLVAVADSMDGKADWEETLAGFVERWVERSDANIRTRTAVLNVVLLCIGTAQMLLLMWGSFDIMSQVDGY